MRNYLPAMIFVLLGGIAVAQPGKPKDDASPHEELVEKVVKNLKAITKQLEKIEDKTSAEAASEPLKKLADEFLDLRRKAAKLKQPDKAEKDRLAEKYQKELAQVIKQMQSEIRRVQGIPAGLDALKELKRALKPPKKK